VTSKGSKGSAIRHRRETSISRRKSCRTIRFVFLHVRIEPAVPELIGRGLLVRCGARLDDHNSVASQTVQRSARFKKSKWVRDDLIERPVLYFGIQRTVPAGERREFKKFATVNYKFSGIRIDLSAAIQAQVARVLGKDVSKFQHAEISDSQNFYVGGDGTVTYSEFHFGAGESSIIRMISEIESAPANAIILIEEIENGLHPVAVRRMVEYLVDVAERKSIQSIFTTHSEDALLPLPSEAIWSSIDGKTRQGRISIEALRAITGRIDQTLAYQSRSAPAVQPNWSEGRTYSGGNCIVRFHRPLDGWKQSGDRQNRGIHRR
jgi:hypothetical protein